MEHALINHAQSQATPKELGAKSWRAVLANRLGISGSAAGRRLAEVAELGARQAVTGAPLDPVLAATAAAQARGEIGAEHVTLIREFMAHLPPQVDPGTRTQAESQLAQLAGGLTPEGLRTVARQLMGYLDQDGSLDDVRQHARKRGLTLGRQELDGMSKLSGWVDPEPGCDPGQARRPRLLQPRRRGPLPGGHPHPSPDQCRHPLPRPTHPRRGQDPLPADAEIRDPRPTQRITGHRRGHRHAGRSERATGHAHTGGGTQIPIPTLLQMAADGAHPYLLLFHNPRQIQLYYGRTGAPPAPDNAWPCTPWNGAAPNPAAPPRPPNPKSTTPNATGNTAATPTSTNSPWPAAPTTASSTTPPTGWTTRKGPSDNRTEWIPPPHLDRGQSRINYHHPENILRTDEDEPG